MTPPTLALALALLTASAGADLRPADACDRWTAASGQQLQQREEDDDDQPMTGSGDARCDCVRCPVSVSCECTGRAMPRMTPDLARNLQKLSIEDSPIDILSRKSLEAFQSSLTELYLSRVPYLEYIEPDTFSTLTRLRTVYIRQAARLTSIHEDVFSEITPEIKAIRIVKSGLDKMPVLKQANLHNRPIISMVDLDLNKIRSVPAFVFNLSANTLSLQYNQIERVEAEAFSGSKLGTLSLKGNRALKKLHPDAFQGLVHLRELDLSETSITSLPTLHLRALPLQKLSLQKTPSLKVFPPVYDFRSIKEALLTYPYHCCAFRFPTAHSPEAYAAHLRWMEDTRKRLCPSPTSSSGASRRRRTPGSFGLFEDIRDRREDNGSRSGVFGDILHPSGGGSGQPLTGRRDSSFHNASVSIDASLESEARCGNLSKNYREVRCAPEPDAFNPCEDVMGNAGLRVGVWVVVVAAVVGNLAVMVVLMSSSFKMTVSKFLMCNLAFADFCMGAYLLIVASVDLHTIGEYFNYAIDWQEGPGCQVAGFLTVFASELSIFTLTVITLERWFAITYAIHLNRRLRLGVASRVMTLGWLFALAFAALPLLGVSSYARTSICLPLEKADGADAAYLLALLTTNGLAFALICACYARMYWSISGRNCTVAQSDRTVAKRMALLVFTDFACWAPIAFFGLTAVAGYPLISVTKAKILLVFFYPLNSCANPFLYAIFTKQYRRDLMLIVHRYGLTTGAKGSSTSANLVSARRTAAAKGSNGSNHRRGSLLTQVSSVDRSSKTWRSAEVQGTLDRRTSADGAGCCGNGCRRLSVVLEAGQPAEADRRPPVSPKHRGSPHPIKNSYTKVGSAAADHELLRHRMAAQDGWTAAVDVQEEPRSEDC